MTDETREQYVRRLAIDALELLKGFTPEQRDAFSNATKTVEEFAGYILELTNSNAYQKGLADAIEAIRALIVPTGQYSSNEAYAANAAYYEAIKELEKLKGK